MISFSLRTLEKRDQRAGTKKLGTDKRGMIPTDKRSKEVGDSRNKVNRSSGITEKNWIPTKDVTCPGIFTQEKLGKLGTDSRRVTMIKDFGGRGKTGR